ncbi:uncharacterized protein LOC122654403 isoform X2 [Telopea speciosissima]|uniref:uncharacterized protein LOC122654403 isoform X2 n=1 Tax=Telopea speciosissima TaxID=54955 RepID=UPI001CC47BFE|nr:uncharacterized protein LOC122654403 isoform X2 [Telopea speciosissima]
MEVSRVSGMFSLCSSIKNKYYSSSLPSLYSLSSFSPLLRTNSRIPVSLKGGFPSYSMCTTRKRNLCIASSGSNTDGFEGSYNQGAAESFFRTVLESMEKVYLSRNPTASAILELVRSFDGDRISYDHLAFRTFGADGYGIDSMAKFFLDFGYTPQEELRFPAKKLKALWFAPPSSPSSENGSGVYGPLPRIFISELLVNEMSPQAQEIIRKYTKISGSGNKHAALASALGSLTWERPLYSDFQQLARESEYAAWTLVNGYAVNHVTISTHQLTSKLSNIKSFNQFIEENGYKLNSEGGTLKVSPDGLLQQSSTVADSISFNFSDGIIESVPCSYIEFAERLVLPQYKNLPEKEVKEYHRRDGFEVGNADKIFESTSMDQLTRKSA